MTEKKKEVLSWSEALNVALKVAQDSFAALQNEGKRISEIMGTLGIGDEVSLPIGTEKRTYDSKTETGQLYAGIESISRFLVSSMQRQDIRLMRVWLYNIALLEMLNGVASGSTELSDKVRKEFKRNLKQLDEKYNQSYDGILEYLEASKNEKNQ